MYRPIQKPLFSAILLFALACCFCLAAPQNGQAAEFKAKMIMHRQGPPSEGFVYVKGDKVRSDMAGPTGLLLTISRGDKGLTWFVNPMRDEYVEVVGLVMGPLGAGNPKAWSKIADLKPLGTDVVEGYLCDKTLYTFHDKKKGTVLQWVARDLHYPIKSIFSGPQGLVTTKFVRIEQTKLKDGLFEVPQGYKLVSRRVLPRKAGK